MIEPKDLTRYVMPSSFAEHFKLDKPGIPGAALAPADWHGDVYAGRLLPLGERVSLSGLPQCGRMRLHRGEVL